ncbi:helix-turn-helix domain-containing protein [Nonomuraea sp. NEAU-A123]|uniref:helix-turn-helix domain-containing protein n=1 Tax=Nonomuraea sp. NEAU-A123 TaxID=2839649 RepID=UPI001BE3D2DA|nr:helix-turn-helix transcriptional regulator [Nonomuraea sp. NEAU-A123]MBT2232288.1 helix-turn-helix domain-containing protein [Nonomuraea sp. NEAU-A123]
MTERGQARFQPQRVAFGNRIRELREAKGLSQEKLADLASIHRTYISSVERGQRNVGLDNVFAIARALEVSPARLFEHAEETNGI